MVIKDLLLEELLLPHDHIIMNIGLIIIHQVHRLIIELQLIQLLGATIIQRREPILAGKLPAVF